jgi:hypothetical protein
MLRYWLSLPARLARLARVAGIVVPAASTAWTPVGFRPGFIHRERPAAGIFAVQACDGLVRFFIIRHFHKTKAP